MIMYHLLKPFGKLPKEEEKLALVFLALGSFIFWQLMLQFMLIMVLLYLLIVLISGLNRRCPRREARGRIDSDLENIDSTIVRLSSNYSGDFYSAPLIRDWDEDGWQPTPTIPLDPKALLTKEWITIDIDVPQNFKRGDILMIRVDITNCHSTKTLYDKGILEIVFPTGARQRYGPDKIILQPAGDTISLCYTWKVPLFPPGSYILRYYLINLQSITEKALAVN